MLANRTSVDEVVALLDLRGGEGLDGHQHRVTGALGDLLGPDLGVLARLRSDSLGQRHQLLDLAGSGVLPLELEAEGHGSVQLLARLGLDEEETHALVILEPSGGQQAAGVGALFEHLVLLRDGLTSVEDVVLVDLHSYCLLLDYQL